ncbi:MAG: ribonuclease PH [Polyangiaceae bacterium]
MSRSDGRALDQHRPVELAIGFHKSSDGSVLYRAGQTVVLCTVSIDASVPAWMSGRGKGWLTAEYQMHPRTSPNRRDQRDGRGKALSGRAQEIQRLVGRALRAAVDMTALGERTLTIDCDVLEADGGTRTAAVTGGFVALAVALARKMPGVRLLRDQVAATSVGHLREGLALDLVYVEDSAARVDMNVVGTATGAVIEVQATAEGDAVARVEVDAMIDLALAGVESLCEVQRQGLAAAGVDLAALMQPGRQA